MSKFHYVMQITEKENNALNINRSGIIPPSGNFGSVPSYPETLLKKHSQSPSNMVSHIQSNESVLGQFKKYMRAKLKSIRLLYASEETLYDLILSSDTVINDLQHYEDGLLGRSGNGVFNRYKPNNHKTMAESMQKFCRELLVEKNVLGKFKARAEDAISNCHKFIGNNVCHRGSGLAETSQSNLHYFCFLPGNQTNEPQLHIYPPKFFEDNFSEGGSKNNSKAKDQDLINALMREIARKDVLLDKLNEKVDALQKADH